MNSYDSSGIYRSALNILTELVPDAIGSDPSRIVIHGDGCMIESITLVNLILALEEELSARLGLSVDLVEFLSCRDGSITLGEFSLEIETRIAKA